jgi:hypothetical protein
MNGTGMFCRPGEQRVTVHPPVFATCGACITSCGGERETSVDFVRFHNSVLVLILVLRIENRIQISISDFKTQNANSKPESRVNFSGESVQLPSERENENGQARQLQAGKG